jgi:hypothetical protein
LIVFDASAVVSAALRADSGHAYETARGAESGTPQAVYRIGP